MNLLKYSSVSVDLCEFPDVGRSLPTAVFLSCQDPEWKKAGAQQVLSQADSTPWGGLVSGDVSCRSSKQFHLSQNSTWEQGVKARAEQL